MRISLQIQGAAELERMLQTLPDRVDRKVIRQAVRSAQKVVRTAEQASARSMVGGEMGDRIARSLQVRAPQRQQRGRYSLHVQLARDEEGFVHVTKAGRREYIPAAIEYGHMAGTTYVPAIPFGRTAAEQATASAMVTFTDALRTGLLREAIKGRQP